MADQTVTISAILRDGFSKNLRGFRQGILNVRNQIRTLTAQVAPLTGQITALATAFVSFEAVRESIRLAGIQVKAEQKLFTALRRNRREFENITKLASELQGRTIIGDEEFIDLAALLLNMNVQANRLPIALQATADVATALDLPIKNVARSIALIEAGTAPVVLSKRVPILRELNQQGRVAAEGLDLLAQRFRGASEGATATAFGKITQEMNILGDQAERIGGLLVQLRLEIVRGVRRALVSLVDRLDTPEIQGVIEILKAILPQLLQIGLIIGGIVAALGLIKIGIILAPIAIIVAKVLIIGGIIAAIVAGLGEIFGFLDPLVKAGDDIFKRVKAILRDLASGKITVEEIFDLVKTRAKAVFIAIRSALFDPIFIFLAAVVKAVTGAFNFAVGSFKTIAGTIANAVAEAFRTVVIGVATAIDFITNRAADAISKLPFVSEEVSKAIRTNLADAVPEFTFADQFVEEGKKLQREGIAGIFSAIVETPQVIAKTIFDGFREIAQLNAELDKRNAQRLKDRVKAEKEAAAKRLEEEKKLIEDILDEQRVLETRLAEIRVDANEEALARIRTRRLRELQAAFNDERISLQAFLREREQLEVQPLRDQLDLRRQNIARIQDAIDALREQEGAQADVRRLLNQMIEARLEEQKIVQDILDIERDLEAVRDEAARKAQERLEKEIDRRDQLVEARARELQQEAEAAFQTLQQEIQEIRRLTSEGFLFPGEGEFREAIALEQFLQTIRQIRAELDAMRGESIEAGFAITDATIATEDLRAAATEANKSGDDLFKGFVAGAASAIENLDELRELGFALGVEFTRGLSGIIDVFIDADKSFTEFAANFLRQIAKMIAQALLFRAISTVIGGINSGGPVLGAASGGPIGFDRGGRVRGPSIDRDVIKAMLTPGEWVIQRPSAQYYGHRIMAAMNKRLIPRSFFAGLDLPGLRGLNLSGRFQGGGGVEDISAPRTSGTADLFVASERQFARLLANGGMAAILREFRKNQQAVRGSIGVGPL